MCKISETKNTAFFPATFAKSCLEKLAIVRTFLLDLVLPRKQMLWLNKNCLTSLITVHIKEPLKWDVYFRMYAPPAITVVPFFPISGPTNFVRPQPTTLAPVVWSKPLSTSSPSATLRTRMSQVPWGPPAPTSPYRVSPFRVSPHPNLQRHPRPTTIYPSSTTNSWVIFQIAT